MRMPEPDAGVIERRAEIIKAMGAIVPGEGVITDADELRAYDHDGLMAYKGLPLIVVLPETTEQVSEILRYCAENGVKIVPRGAGTGLSGPKEYARGLTMTMVAPRPAPDATPIR